MHGYHLAPDAMADVRSGLVDQRVLDLLERLSREHDFSVRMIKTGHPMGPVSPAGRENTHYFYRAVDLSAVGGAAVAERPVAEPVIALGRTLLALREGRPDTVMGPAEWHDALGDGDRRGFRTDEHANRVHTDHLHLGYDRLIP